MHDINLYVMKYRLILYREPFRKTYPFFNQKGLFVSKEILLKWKDY